MKKYLILLLISFLFLPSFVFAKENLNKNDKYFEMENPDGVYTVTFNTNGGNSIDSQTVSEGGKASDPGKPVRDGYKFIGWYRDEELTEPYNFSDSVTSNITIYAKWNEILTSAGAHITVPVRGKLAPLDIKSDDESKYKVQVDYWYLSDRDAGYPHVGADELLQPGKTYKLRFTFIPNEGYVFNDNPTTTLNGKVTQKYGVPSHCEYAFFVKDQLNQTKASTSSVKIEWEKRKDAKGYLVQVKSGSKWKAIKTITKNSTTNLTIKKLKAGTKYTYRVRAYKIVKNKKTIINTTNTITAITTPKNPEVTLTLKDYNAMNINIKGVKGGNNYAVQRSTDGKTYLLFKRVFEPTTIPQEDLVLGQKYYYRVQACNKNGYCSKWTTVSRVQTTKTPGFSIKTSSKKVTITMSKVNGADGYQIYSSTKKKGKYSKIKEFSSEVELLEYVNKTTKGKTYYYKVRTFKLNTEGKRIYSPYSKIKSIKSK